MNFCLLCWIIFNIRWRSIMSLTLLLLSIISEKLSANRMFHIRILSACGSENFIFGINAIKDAAATISCNALHIYASLFFIYTISLSNVSSFPHGHFTVNSVPSPVGIISYTNNAPETSGYFFLQVR